MSLLLFSFDSATFFFDVSRFQKRDRKKMRAQKIIKHVYFVFKKVVRRKLGKILTKSLFNGKRLS